MTRLLDTNTCIYYLNQSSDRLMANFRKYSPSELKLSSLTVAELFYGAEKSKAKKKNITVVERFITTFEIMAFDDACCKTYAIVRASLEKAGTPIGPMDLLIASISIAHHFVLVTNNTKEFRRVKKLKLENWL